LLFYVSRAAESHVFVVPALTKFAGRIRANNNLADPQGPYNQGSQQNPSYAQPVRMADSNQQKPQLGATFYPGGMDDFYMPEVISPLPQRYD
jgi:hypothetical protein